MRRAKRAYTLTELIVALMVMAALSTIAVATHSTLRERASQQEAEASIGRVIAAQRAWAAARGSWAEGGELPPLRGVRADSQVSSSPKHVSMSLGAGRELGLAARSRGGACVAVVLPDPLSGAAARKIQIEEGSPCAGGGALASAEQ